MHGPHAPRDASDHPDMDFRIKQTVCNARDGECSRELVDKREVEGDEGADGEGGFADPADDGCEAATTVAGTASATTALSVTSEELIGAGDEPAAGPGSDGRGSLSTGEAVLDADEATPEAQAAQRAAELAAASAAGQQMAAAPWCVAEEARTAEEMARGEGVGEQVDDTSPAPGEDWHTVRSNVRNRVKVNRGYSGKARLLRHADEVENAKAFVRRKPSVTPSVTSPGSGGAGAAAAAGGNSDDPSAAHEAFFAWAGTPSSSGYTPPADDAHVGGTAESGTEPRRSDADHEPRSPRHDVDMDMTTRSAGGFAGQRARWRHGVYGQAMRSVSRSTGVPWASDAAFDESPSLFSALRMEINDWVRFVTRAGARQRGDVEALIRSLQDAVSSCWPGAVVEVYGSYSTGLWLPSSDIDVVITSGESPKPIDFGKRAVPLRKLARQLHGEAWVESITVIDSAAVPVLKLGARMHGTGRRSRRSSNPMEPGVQVTPIDVTFEPPQASMDTARAAPLHNGSDTRAFVRSMLDEHDELRPLVLVLKQFLREAGLNEPFQGGLSSYSVVLMTLSFLQHCKREEKHGGKELAQLPALPPVVKQGTTTASRPVHDVGYLLFAFLQHFSSFDHRRVGISCRDGGKYFAVEAVDESVAGPVPLVLEDPLNPSRNVAGACYAFSRVSSVLADAKLALEYFRPTRYRPTPLSVIISPHTR